MSRISPVYLLGVLLAGPASAATSSVLTTPALILSDNLGNSVTIVAGGTATCIGSCKTTAPASSSPGTITWGGTLGVFTVAAADGKSQPVLPVSQIILDLLVTTGASGGTLTAKWSELGFSGIGDATMTASQALSGSVSATYTGYIDNTNAPFGMKTAVGTIGPITSSSGATVDGPGAGGEPFSMTEIVVATMGPDSALSLADSTTVPRPSLTLACASASGQMSLPYSSPLMATGGFPPYAFTIAGSLPSGLSLNSSTGEIGGTPGAPGASSFTAQVMDSSGNPAHNTVQSNCSITITVSPEPLALACPATGGEAGVAYSSFLTATGGVEPYGFSTSTSLPPGLVLNSAIGAITGTPATAGPFSFTAQVVDSSGNPAGNTAARSCAITIAPALALACPAGTGQVGVPYSSSLSASGGIGPDTFSVSSGSLPPGSC